MRIEGTDEITVDLKYGIVNPKDKNSRLRKITVREIIGDDEMAINRKDANNDGKKMTLLMLNTFCAGDGQAFTKEDLTLDLFRDMYLPDREKLFVAIYHISFGKIPVLVEGCPKHPEEGMFLAEKEFDELDPAPADSFDKPKNVLSYTFARPRIIREQEISKLQVLIPRGDFQEEGKTPSKAELVKKLVKVPDLKGEPFLSLDEVQKLPLKELNGIVGTLYANYWGLNTMQEVQCIHCDEKHFGMYDTKNFFRG